MNIWNNHYQDSIQGNNSLRRSQDEINHISLGDKLAQFELIITSTQDLIDSSNLNTDFLENSIKKNEIYFKINEEAAPTPNF